MYSEPTKVKVIELAEVTWLMINIDSVLMRRISGATASCGWLLVPQESVRINLQCFMFYCMSPFGGRRCWTYVSMRLRRCDEANELFTIDAAVFVCVCFRQQLLDVSLGEILVLDQTSTNTECERGASLNKHLYRQSKQRRRGELEVETNQKLG